MIEVVRGPYVEALLWLNLIAPEVVEIHACASSEARGRWISRNLVHTLYDTLVEETGASACIAQTPTPKIASFWERLGFINFGRFAVLDLKERLDGRSAES